MERYIGLPLGDDEYLLKIRESNDEPNTGFITKLTKKNELPKTFDEWGGINRWNPLATPLPIYIHKEVFAKGWKIYDWRFGQSQNWATMIHPNGFTLEIYLDDLLEIIQDNTVINGELIGEFKWEANTLIKK